MDRAWNNGSNLISFGRVLPNSFNTVQDCTYFLVNRLDRLFIAVALHTRIV
jgi:hypothetical protein